MPDDNFCCPENYSVLIPYRDLVKIADMAKNYEVILAQNKRLQEQYTAIQGMFSECLLEIKKIRDFVRD